MVLTIVLLLITVACSLSVPRPQVPVDAQAIGEMPPSTVQVFREDPTPRVRNTSVSTEEHGIIATPIAALEDNNSDIFLQVTPGGAETAKPRTSEITAEENITISTFDLVFEARRYPPELITNWGNRNQPMWIHNNASEIRYVYCSSDAGTVDLFDGDFELITGQGNQNEPALLDSVSFNRPGFLIGIALAPNYSIRITGVEFNHNTPITDPDTGAEISGGHYNTWCEEKATIELVDDEDEVIDWLVSMVNFYYNNRDRKPNVTYFNGVEFVDIRRNGVLVNP